MEEKNPPSRICYQKRNREMNQMTLHMKKKIAFVIGF